jgi:hypothetical protein
MSILLPALGVAMAAFCVWLGVRIVNRRERWAKWTAVAFILVVAAIPASYPWAKGILLMGPDAESKTGMILFCSTQSNATIFDLFPQGRLTGNLAAGRPF